MWQTIALVPMASWMKHVGPGSLLVKDDHVRLTLSRPWPCKVMMPPWTHWVAVKIWGLYCCCNDAQSPEMELMMGSLVWMVMLP